MKNAWIVLCFVCLPVFAGDDKPVEKPVETPKPVETIVVKDCDSGKFTVMTRLTGVTGIKKITIIGKKMGGFFLGKKSDCDCK